MQRAFACFRTAVFAPLFIALWTWYIPRWTVGVHAYDGPRPAGWLVVAAGAVIALPAIGLFAWRGLGTPAVFDPPRRLVVSGPYRFVRNPMYTGMALVLLGEALVFPHLTNAMLLTLALFILAVTLFVAAYEEPVLRAKFGADYEAYCRHVRRWIPRLRPFDNAANAAVE
jgi:protein-S-isoprenylcysteine O-methyltransferase Ste14